MSPEEVSAKIASLEARVTTLEREQAETKHVLARVVEEARSVVKGAIMSFNHDFAQSCEEWLRRWEQVKKTLWGEHGANGLSGDMRMLRSNIKMVVTVLLLCVPAVTGALAYVTVTYVLPDFENASKN